MIVLFLMLLLPQDRTAATEKIAELVRQLGDDEQQTREAAMKDLMAAGMAAIPLLEEAKIDEDAEIRLRAGKLLKIIPLRARLAFSGKLLEEYPDLYEDLARCGPAGDVYAILKKVALVKDGVSYHASDGDIASLVRETMRDDRKGLTTEEKVTIIGICGGQRNYVQVGEVSTMREGGLVEKVPIYEWGVGASEPVIDAIPELAKLAQDGDGDVRQEAMKTFNALGLKKASPALRTMLADEDKETRKRAVAVLRGLGVSEGEIDRMTQEAITEEPKKE